jgi:hypothetical protein
MVDGARERGSPFLLDLYAAAVASMTGLGRGRELALEALVNAQTTVDEAAARGRGPGWLLRQFREGTISWALVAFLVLVTFGLMSLFAAYSRG